MLFAALRIFLIGFVICRVRSDEIINAINHETSCAKKIIFVRLARILFICGIALRTTAAPIKARLPVTASVFIIGAMPASICSLNIFPLP